MFRYIPAYNQWTQFETFPEFMECVDRVEQRTPRLTRWGTALRSPRRSPPRRPAPSEPSPAGRRGGDGQRSGSRSSPAPVWRSLGRHIAPVGAVPPKSNGCGRPRSRRSASWPTADGGIPPTCSRPARAPSSPGTRHWRRCGRLSPTPSRSDRSRRARVSVGPSTRPPMLPASRSARRRSPAARIPFRLSRIRLEKPGFRAVDAGMWLALAKPPPFVLDSDTLPAGDGMVRVAGGETDVNLPGLDHLAPLRLGDYLIGRYEVTNRAFKRFVDAGGYRKRELWKHRFVSRGREVAWGDAMARFTDKTGRPGPAAVGGGQLPRGAGGLSRHRRELVRGRRVRGVRRGRAADDLPLEPGRVHLGRCRHRARSATSAARDWRRSGSTRASGPTEPPTWRATPANGA